MDVWAGSLGCRLVLVSVIAAFGISVTTGTGSRTVLAQTRSPAAPASHIRSGLVTSAKSGTTLQIDHTDYPLAPRVTIADDEGRPREERDLQPGVQVQYHLKDGRIDQVVIVLPK